MKCLRCQQENPPQAKVCLKCGTPFVPIEEDPGPGALYAGIHSAPSEVVEQQATAAFSITLTSATDVQPALGAIARTAARLCEAGDALIYVVDGDQHRFIAKHGRVEQPQRLGDSHPIRRDTPLGLAVLDRRPVHVRDIRADLHGRFSGLQDVRILVSRVRTVLAMPLLREGVTLGGIVIRRTRVQPFTAKQVALLKTFADQAAIVIENLRLFTELQEKNRALTQAHAQVTEALEQQTATGEILRVISSSPTDVQPVLDTIVSTGARLCEADYGFLARYDGTSMAIAAHSGATDEEIEAVFRVYPMVPTPDSLGGRTILERTVVHIPDVRRDPTYGRRVIQDAGWRTGLGVPLLREGAAIGLLGMWRRDVRPFSDQQIALLQTFADQAVIAIENVRLFNETKEALEQQTATAEILRVISSSPTDIQPVLDAVTATAARVCGATDALIMRVEGQGLRRVAHFGPIPLVLPAVRPLTAGSASGRAIVEGRTIHIHDILATDAARDYPDALPADAGVQWRTMLAVPLVREGAAIGAILIRRTEIRPFTAKQIQLLETFASQAVIAIENVRLFTELQASNRELRIALDTQTATGDILRVISRSQTDVQPVFDAIVASAVRLLGAYSGTLTRIAGKQIELAAITSTSDVGDAALRARFPQPLSSAGPHARTIRDRAPLNIADAHTDPRLPEAVHAYARVRGYRSQVAVPMLRHDEAIGTISLTRGEPGGFTADEIGLLQTFADQAVIAIENVRLFTELQEKNEALTRAHAQMSESLEQQTATADILRVISSSPTDVQPVFDTIVKNAVWLCDAVMSNVQLFDGERMHWVAQQNINSETVDSIRRLYPMRPDRTQAASRAVLARSVVHLPDVLDDSEYDREMALKGGWRSVLSVPMLRGGDPIGTITVARRERFTGPQIALLQTFADQAVIAIENVRLFKELESRNAALTNSLEQQTVTAEILRVISSSPTELQPVFDTILANACRLCSASLAVLWRLDGEVLIGAAHHNASSRFAESIMQPVRPSREGPARVAALERRVVHVADITTEPGYAPMVLQHERARTVLAVPLLRDDSVVGVVAIWRREVQPFTDQQIALLKTFADQAVIAIENVRLFNELQARTQQLTRSVEQLTALREVGHAVSSSLDLETVLNTIVARAVQLAGAHSGTIWEYDAAAEEFVLRITQNVEDAELRANPNARVGRGEGAVGRLAVSLRPVQIPDITYEGAYEGRLRDSLVGAGTRALLAIPLLHEDQLLGGLVISRRTPGEFPAEVVDLLASFATQSALALQNARLFLEIEDKSRQLEAASQHKSEFLANMSHELRTPLNAIIGFSEVLSERLFGELNEKQEEYLKDIHASGQHLLSLINDILDLSKIEAGRMELELADFDLPTAIDNALTLVRERAGRRGVALHQVADEGLGQIRADERKIKQVLLNLLSNAIKFTPEGGRIDVRARPVDGSVEVSVTDTGVGIAPEDQEAIFEEFRQVGTAAKTVEGTGLGLALSRKFIGLHGGRIWVKSEMGMGSTFTFTIPVRHGE